MRTGWSGAFPHTDHLPAAAAASLPDTATTRTRPSPAHPRTPITPTFRAVPCSGVINSLCHPAHEHLLGARAECYLVLTPSGGFRC